MSIAPLNRTFRGARRIESILRVLVRYGFDDFIHESGLSKWLGKSTSGDSDQPASARTSPRAVRLREALEELGPTFIKLGQILSTRPDLIPTEWAQEFKRLQSDCPQVPFDKIRDHLEHEFPSGTEEVFLSIDPQAIAAASIAQVHAAVLRDGTEVVIKVLRPGLRRAIETDMDVLAALAQLVEHFFSELGYSPTQVVKEFTRELQREVDLTNEARSTERLREYFEDNPNVVFPKVFWQGTTRDVLTMERMNGVLLSDINADNLSEDKRRSIVAHGAEAVFRQCLEFGFFHADPHPGNIMVLEGDRICFLDCGMTGHLDRRTSEQLADLIAGVVSGDVDRVIHVAIALSGADPGMINDRAFRADTWAFIRPFQDATLDQLNPTIVLDDFFDLLRRYRLRCPADIVFLIKAISTIQSVGESLDPTFDIVAHVKPFVEELVSRRWGMAALRRRFQKSLIKYAEFAEGLPGDVQTLLAKLRGNRLSINLEHQRLDRLTDALEHASRNIAWALIISSLVVASSILILADQMAGGTTLLRTLGIIGFFLATAITMIMAVRNLRLWRRE